MSSYILYNLLGRTEVGDGGNVIAGEKEGERESEVRRRKIEKERESGWHGGRERGRKTE